MSTGIVFIAEFIRSWAAYGFSPHSRNAIARRCGLEYIVEPIHPAPASRQAQPAIGEDDDEGALDGKGIEFQRSDKFDAEGPPESPGQAAGVPPTPAPPRPEEPVPQPNRAATRLKPAAAASDNQTQFSDWWRNLEPLAPSPQRARTDELPAPEPLLRRPWQRAIIGEIAATFRAEGEPDVPALVEALAQQRLPKQIPRRRVKTNRLGLYCYLDIGDGMEPFAADQKDFVREMQKVIGKDLLSVKRFRGTPQRTQRGHAFTDDLPRAGSPVLLLSDLGIGRPRHSEDPAPAVEWLEFASMLAQAGNSLIALLPYPSARWPIELQQAMTILFWDPSTNARIIATALRPKHRFR